MSQTIHTRVSPDGPATDTRDNRGRLALVVLLTGQFMALLDVSVTNIAMPAVQRDLHASGAALQLVVAGYTVSYAMLLITGARLGDIFGRRRVFLIGVLVFTLSSLACGLSPTTVFLVVARLIQGAGAALMMPQVVSTIQVRFTGAARARALSAYAAVIAVGAVAGLVLGGVLVSANLWDATWRPVFLVNVPVGIAVAVAVPLAVPADRPGRTRKLDLVGLAISVPAVCLVVVPLVLGHQNGWPAWTFVSLAAGLVLAAVFVVVERRIEQPLLKLPVLRVPGFGAGLATLAAGMVAYGGFLFAAGLHLQTGLGYSALKAGLTFAPVGTMFGLFGYHWRRLPARFHRRLPTVGYIVGAIGYLAGAAVLAGPHHPTAAIIAGLLPFGVGMGLAFSPLMTHLLANVPGDLAADASGLVTTTFQLSQVIGVALFGSLFLTLAARPVPFASSGAIAVTMLGTAALLAVGTVLSLRAAKIRQSV